MSAAFIGLDLAKLVFQVHGVDIHGKVMVMKRLRRDARPYVSAATKTGWNTKSDDPSSRLSDKSPPNKNI
jgi:hypothetical protein